MIGVWLLLFGLALGSFVNALVWRVYQMSLSKNKRKATDAELSIITGKSMCPNCKHGLAWYDLVPILSWVLLRGRCRYCRKPISWQYPLVEVATAAVFLASYVFWPYDLTSGVQQAVLGLWLAAVVALMALLVYDLKWMLLPNKIMVPLAAIALISAIIVVLGSDDTPRALADSITSVTVSGGLFMALFQLSKGEWIGGGDVKLGAALGLLLAQPELAFIMLFGASLLGLLVALPSVLRRKATFNSKLPFGPYLITAAVLAQLFGAELIAWYTDTFLHL